MYTDLLIRIKNAQAVNKTSVFSPFSKMDLNILKLLVNLGYLNGVEVKKNDNKPVIRVNLNKNKKIKGLKFTSVPSRKISLRAKDIKPVKGGIGFVIISTSAGIMTGHEAKKKKIGGQVLFEIW